MTQVWSFGILIYAMVTGTIPFKAKSIPELHKLIIEAEFGFPDSVKLSAEFKDLIR